MGNSIPIGCATIDRACFPETYCPLMLCVDDDPEISQAIALRLRNYQVNVLRAFYGAQGMWLAVTEKPDFVITDVRAVGCR